MLLALQYLSHVCPFLIGIFIFSSITLLAQDNGDNHHRNQNTSGNNDRNDNRDNRNNQVPDKVQHSFQQDYPNAQNPQWNNTNGQWHGAYKDKDNRVVDAYYNGEGQRIDTHSSYNQNELPERVRDRANRRYQSDYRSYRIDRPSSHPLFEIRLEGGRNFYYDENGRKRRYRDRH